MRLVQGITAATLLLGGAALAQMGPGGFGGPGGMQPPPPGANKEKEEGPAEEAPEETRPADLEPLSGYAEQNKRRMQIFELDGYLRLRSDWMHQFALGQGYTTIPSGNFGNYGLPPFPLPAECWSPSDPGALQPGDSNRAAPQNPQGPCTHKNIGAANTRFRLQPTINVTDQVRVHALIDILDNTILGSTPDTLAGIEGVNRPVATGAPSDTPGGVTSGFLNTTQYPPEVGANGFVGSFRAKRAWAEVDSEFGSIRFGRMPWHWGRGIYYNQGACPDCDVGTTVDRVMGLTTLYGHQLAASWDLGAQGPTTQTLSLGRDDPSGYQYDLSQNDDITQFMASITRIDSPVTLRERVDRGDIVVNYGLQVVYRNQDNIVLSRPTPGPIPPTGVEPQTPDQLLHAQPYGALSVTPDVWFKLQYKALTIEFEGVGVFGRINRPYILAHDDQTKLTLFQLGWVVASELRLFRDSFFVGMETGGATGDQAENPGQYLGYRWKFVQQPQGDHSIRNFLFSPDYHVDQIFFRHIIGTVTNAIYIKPQAAYWFDLGNTRAIGLQGAAIYSMAQVPVSTPGNALSYGVETDIGVGYRNTAEGFYAGATWGIFFPMGALNRPGTLWTDTGAEDASTAQMVRVYMGVKF
jgi:uncharacterized protein (TIGR04551 family)